MKGDKSYLFLFDLVVIFCKDEVDGKYLGVVFCAIDLSVMVFALMF